MKHAGIIGGLGPESTVDYYQSFIKKYQEKVNSKQKLPELFINSINMYNIFRFISEGKLDALVNYVGEAAQKLESIGADFIIISANTPHIVFDQVREKVGVPMISIVEATYEKAEELGLKRLGLLGTKFTMENDFFKKPFITGKKDIFVPDEDVQQYLHQKIVDELENGIVDPQTKQDFLKIVHDMAEKENLDGLILGCTELPMIINEDDTDLALLNTTEIHVDKMIEQLF
ncbi:amino acid racemase [Virgibacillus dakarensis]|uniref:Racemase n=1 Tax=Lentibacillus populi TaxID=1827502 RepID=A0A9W5U233_9BACI|nr:MULTISPECIES: amino acid racemase [Bacillaceae]MBT2216455.1 amino acid racemase [Virgibacillus dakarensis]MTW85850.1 amino acid racemase [Virgibacillus dakarensis]GGB59995.1 racemase [Lentibacillus populi]